MNPPRSSMTCCFLSNGMAQSTAGRYTNTLKQSNIGQTPISGKTRFSGVSVPILVCCKVPTILDKMSQSSRTEQPRH